MFALKIPVGLLCWIVYWAFKAETPLEEAPEDGGEDRYRSFRRQPKHPGGPRRPGAPDAMSLPAGRHDGRTRKFTPPAPTRAGTAHARGAAEPASRD